MESSPRFVRERLVRDYSGDNEYDNYRPHPSPQRERWTSPQRHIPIKIAERNDSPGEDEEHDVRKLEFQLESLAENSTYEPSVSTQPTSSSGNNASRMADFFGPEVYQIVLNNPTTQHQLKKFAQARLCSENLEFLERVCSEQVCDNVTDVYRSITTRDASTK